MIARSMQDWYSAGGMAAILFVTGAGAQEVKHYRFAYDQPRNTGYSIAGDLFADKLKELSKGTMIIDQYPGAQLGQEPQVLQLVKAGDIEFCDHLLGQHRDDLAASGRDVAALPVPRREPRGQGAGRSEGVRSAQDHDRRDHAGRCT